MKRVAFLVLALTACATSPVSIGTPEGEQRAIYQAESDFSAALALAVAYRKLPACGGTEAICSDPATVAKIAASAEAARAALYTAEGLARAGSPAAQVQTAVAAALQDVQAFSLAAEALSK